MTLEATGSFEADESSDVAPEASGPRRRHAGRRRPVRQGGRGARPAAGRRRRAAARRSARGGQPRRSQRQARRIAEHAGADDGAALRVAAGDRRRLEHGRGSGAHERRDLGAEREHRARLARRRRARSWRSPRRRSPTSRSSRRSPGSSASATSRSASTCSRRPPVVTLLKIDPLRLQLTIPGVQAGQSASARPSRATVDAFPEQTFTGRITAVNPAISAEVALVHRRGARAEPRGAPQARACSRSRRSIRAGR